MKKVFYLILNFIVITVQIGISQKSYSISGVVFSEISELPVEQTDLRITIEGSMSKKIFLNDKAEFQIKSLSKGQYKLILEVPSEAGDYFTAIFDTILVLDKVFKTNLKLVRRCFDCCSDYGVDKQRALKDVKEGKPALYLPPTGISGDMNLMPNDFKFEEKYHVKYQAQGCTFPDFECLRSYNLVVFEFLDKKFGRKWRNEARNNVLFLKKKN